MKSLAALGALAVGGLTYAHLETKWFTVREATVPVLPSGWDPVRVLHVSDLHLTPTQHRKLDWVRSLADLAPDLVINTGDNLGHVGSVGPLLDAFGSLLEVPGAFVFGSNDYHVPVPKNPARYLLPDSRLPQPPAGLHDFEALRIGLTAGGWLDLNNARGALALPGNREIAFVGTDDAHLDRDVFPSRDLRRSSSAAEGGACRDHGQSEALHLGVTHAPYLRVLQEMKDDGTQMVFAGHTHGGQLAVPGFGALVTNCDLDRRRAKGVSGWPGARPDAPHGRGADSMWLNVSAGAGTSPYAPFRFACRPEASLLTLVPRA